MAHKDIWPTKPFFPLEDINIGSMLDYVEEGTHKKMDDIIHYFKVFKTNDVELFELLEMAIMARRRMNNSYEHPDCIVHTRMLNFYERQLENFSKYLPDWLNLPTSSYTVNS